MAYHQKHKPERRRTIRYGKEKKSRVLLEVDSRYQYARSKVIDRIKSNNHFQVNGQNLKSFRDALPTDVAHSAGIPEFLRLRYSD
ncbi:MAG: hypothetical protein IPO69_09000 [Saprospiraceae bacterium]|nr:hypothetical protein [Saprospiraceae bacterium]